MNHIEAKLELRRARRDLEAARSRHAGAIAFMLVNSALNKMADNLRRDNPELIEELADSGFAVFEKLARGSRVFMRYMNPSTWFGPGGARVLVDMTDKLAELKSRYVETCFHPAEENLAVAFLNKGSRFTRDNSIEALDELLDVGNKLVGVLGRREQSGGRCGWWYKQAVMVLDLAESISVSLKSATKDFANDVKREGAGVDTDYLKSNVQDMNRLWEAYGEVWGNEADDCFIMREQDAVGFMVAVSRVEGLDEASLRAVVQVARHGRDRIKKDVWKKGCEGKDPRFAKKAEEFVELFIETADYIGGFMK